MLNENILPTVSPIDRFDRMADALYTAVNYDQLLADFAQKGLHMKENKGFYTDRFMSDLESLLKGKTKEEIAILLRDFYELMLV